MRPKLCIFVGVSNLPKSHSVTVRIPVCKYQRRRWRHPRLAAALRQCVLLAGALITVGCAIANPPNVICPVTRVLEDPAQLTRFKPGVGRDITDIDFDAAFAENTGAGTCEIDDDKIDVELKILIVANRGTANTSRRASFDFFITVVDQDDNVLVQNGSAFWERFEGQVDFSGNQTWVTYTDEFVMTIPLKSGLSARDLRIFIGFELSSEELEYNRTRRRR
jgi:hypothetical protein